MPRPFVSILLVNYNGKDYLSACLQSLEKLNYPRNRYEIIVVDNNSYDLSVEFIKEHFPAVIVLSSKENLGFSKGNNKAAAAAKGKYIVLLNNDTTVDPNWLEPLVNRAEKDPSIAAVNSKLLSYNRFIELEIESTTHSFAEFSSHFSLEAVGVLIERIILKEEHLQNQIFYKSGFLEEMKGSIAARWTKGNARIVLPFSPSSKGLDFIITLRAQKSMSHLKTHVKLTVADTILLEENLDSYEVKQCSVHLPQKLLEKGFQYQVTNAGNVVFRNGQSRDRGAAVKKNFQVYELDNPFYKKPTHVPAFCGASVLLRREQFLELGGFNEDFFMYYEDIDLSLRLRRLGYWIFFEPLSIVYHHHAGSSKEWSPFFTLQVEKNHLLLVLIHFPMTVFIYEYIRECLLFSASIVRAIRWRIQENWDTYEKMREQMVIRFKVLKEVLFCLPQQLQKRRKLNGMSKLSLESLYETLY